jgi:hypothetical protein
VIASGTSLVSTSITPTKGDALFAEVTIPAVLNSVKPPTSIAGCAASWSVAKQQLIETNQGLAVWYQGAVTTNKSSGCKVTVTLQNGNPAALKVYDVPKFSKMIETSNGTTGPSTSGPTVSSGSVTITHTPDLLLGNLLLANQQFTPQAYWGIQLIDPGSACSPQNVSGCPTDDGMDYLPGYGTHSSNSDSGHQILTTAGTYSLSRTSFGLGSSDFGGAAIAIELTP